MRHGLPSSRAPLSAYHHAHSAESVTEPTVLPLDDILTVEDRRFCFPRTSNCPTYIGTTIHTDPSPLQNRQRSLSMSFPETEHSRHLAAIGNSAFVVSSTL